MPYDFGTIESKWLERWEKDKIFQPTETGKKYLLTVPYPYANGALHIGHGRTYTIGDIMARYLRMKGYNVLYPMGFHISGTPILGFAKKIEKGDRGTIELYKSYLELYGDNPDLIKEFSKPENIANYFANKIISDFSNMGFSIDWSRVFNTGEPIYNKFIEWQFRKLFSMGFNKTRRLSNSIFHS
jgi:leucyl-tRNA synthetase (EC 6.1.1.4)